MSESAGKAVFLSYASQDAEAARRIAKALQGAGVEVWFDQSELVGGDAWDQKIRGQVASCALFVPVVSAATQARREGYFRLEWKLADERTHLMAEGTPFLLPVVIDDTKDREALVPKSFLGVQWTRLATGETTPAFVALVQKLLHPAAAQASSLPPVSQPGTPLARQPSGSSLSWLLPASLSVAAVGALAFWQPWKTKAPPTSATPAAASATVPKPVLATPAAAVAGADKSLAVLAFDNRSDDKANDSLSDGISEELLNVLSKVPGLTVMARASSFHFKGRNAPAQEIGQKLGVAHLVSGSVQRLGNSVRIFAELIRTDTGVQVWTQRFDGELTNPWELQERIAGRIAEELKLKLGASARATKTVNPDAYRLLLEARHFWLMRTEEGFASAEEALRKALALDPRFAEAHAALADVAVMRAAYRQLEGETDVAADLARASEQAKRALALDASLPEPPAALAYVAMLERRLADAERGYQQILAVNPNHSMIHTWRGVTQFYTGRLDLALEEFEKAITLDPLYVIHHHMAGNALTMAGRLDEALALDARAAALRSYIWPPNRGELAALLWQKGRKEEAVAAARFVRQLWPQKPRWFADSNAIWVLQQAGLRDEAAAYAAQLLKELPEMNSHRGLVLAALGRFDDALPYLERCGIMSNRSLFWAPMWDQWRDDHRFKQLMVNLGCAAEYDVARETLTRMLKKQAAKK